LKGSPRTNTLAYWTSVRDEEKSWLQGSML